jgi:hypothetical protein
LAVAPSTFSIVINNYNYGRYLAEAIDSALAQTYPHTEVVVVDDGSTDDSRDILAAYGDRVRVVLKANGGQASAFNAGFALSTGSVVLFLDSDDSLMPDAAERVMAVWRPGLAKVHFRLRDMASDGRSLSTCTPRLGEPLPVGDLAPEVVAHGFYKSPPTSGNAFSREALAAVMPLDETVWRIAADSPLLFMCPFTGDVEAIQEPLGHYRRHDASASMRRSMDAETLLTRIARGRALGSQVAALAARRGLTYQPGRGPLATITLLWLKVLAPDRFPSPRRATWRLALDVALSGWRLMPTVKKRIAFTGAVALIPFLPAPFAKNYVNWLFGR